MCASLYRASTVCSTIPACSLHIDLSISAAHCLQLRVSTCSYSVLHFYNGLEVEFWVKATLTVSPNSSPSVQSMSPVQSRVQVLHLPGPLSGPVSPCAVTGAGPLSGPVSPCAVTGAGPLSGPVSPCAVTGAGLLGMWAGCSLNVILMREQAVYY